MTDWIADSWAWVEYIRGSDKGTKLRDELERGSEIFTHPVTIAELVSKFKRENLDAEIAWKAVNSTSKVITVDSLDAKEAGLTHASTKAKKPNFSLADAFVLQSARKLNCRILTGDPDFDGIAEAFLLAPPHKVKSGRSTAKGNQNNSTKSKPT
jgi:predicted nucleic acid-binding protein